METTPPEWNLADLYEGPSDPRLDSDLTTIGEEAKRFAGQYQSHVGELAPEALCVAIADYERVQQTAARPSAFASLRFAAETSPQNGALMQRIQEKQTAATLPMIFFDVELSALGAARLRELADDSALSAYRHFLRKAAAHAAHSLTEPEERISAELANTGRRSFVRLFGEITSGLRVAIPGESEPLNFSRAMNLQFSPDREVRRASAAAITSALEGQARTLAFIVNTLVQDKATQDRLRHYAYPEEARHISNELSPETVETVVGVVVEGYDLVARFYRTKQRLLGLPELAHYDRYAPLPADGPETPIEFDAARDLVMGAFKSFDDTTYANAAGLFFDKGWIDAEVRPDKRGGAFCSFVTPDLHPYILLNYLGKNGDVRTLAHELGHGIHSYLSRSQSYLNYHGTLPMAEVASTFAEMLVFEKSTRNVSDQERLVAYAHQIDQGIATIFRQTALYRFEQTVHAERRNSGELTVERIGEIWQEKIGEMFGDSVTLEPGHALWWSYIGHFISTPFYVYAYSFGEMLALALFHRYQQEGDDFMTRYLDMLRAGGSLSPAELVAPMGIDLEDRTFWTGALDVLEAEVVEFERLAKLVAPEKFAD